MKISEGLAGFAALYEEHPLEALSLANAFTCNLLEVLTDKETAMKFCEESGVLLANLINSYTNQSSNQSSED